MLLFSMLSHSPKCRPRRQLGDPVYWYPVEPTNFTAYHQREHLLGVESPPFSGLAFPRRKNTSAVPVIDLPT